MAPPGFAAWNLAPECQCPNYFARLESTVNLAELRLDHVVADNRALTLPFVSLPTLAQLDFDLTGTLTPGTVLLEHLSIPPQAAR